MNKLLKIKSSFLMLISAGVLLLSCDKKLEDITTGNTPSSTSEKKSELKTDHSKKTEDSLIAAQEAVQYKAFIFPAKKKDSAMSIFTKEYSDEEQYKILALNRLDKKNRWRADSLVIPSNLEADFMSFSPFPLQLDSLKNVNKLIMFSYEIHAFGVYENGNLIKWGPSSLGKKATPTKEGLMFANWKKEVAISTSNSEWKLRWNVNIHNTAGIGFHQYDLPGYHASHSCLRLLENDAKWLYDWVDTWVLINNGNTVKAKGTPVIVFGERDFKSKPWLKLLNDPLANNYSHQQINDVVSPFLSEIMKEQQNSQQVRGEKLMSKKNEKKPASESTGT